MTSGLVRPLLKPFRPTLFPPPARSAGCALPCQLPLKGGVIQGPGAGFVGMTGIPPKKTSESPVKRPCNGVETVLQQGCKGRTSTLLDAAGARAICPPRSGSRPAGRRANRIDGSGNPDNVDPEHQGEAASSASRDPEGGTGAVIPAITKEEIRFRMSSSSADGTHPNRPQKWINRSGEPMESMAPRAR